MSEIFTASNGRKVQGSDRFETGIRVSGFIWAELSNEQTQALREYFLAERDKELGRWRDPVDSTFIVRSRNDELVTVFDEIKCEGTDWNRAQVAQRLNSICHGYDTAERYFDAHPEKKPWHDAEPGEWWEITFNGETHKALVDLEHDFSYLGEGRLAEYVHRSTPVITAGRKL